MRDKKKLCEGSDKVAGNDGPTEMGAYLRMSIVGTIVASTYSLLPVVSDVPSRNRGEHTKMNNTRTDDPSVLPPQAGIRGNDTPNEVFPDQIYSICP